MKKSFFLFLFCFCYQIAFAKIITSTQINDSLNYYYELATKPNSPDDFTKAYYYYQKHKKSCLLKNNIEGAVYDLRLLAIIQNESGFLHDSEVSCTEGLKLLGLIKNNTFKTNAQIGFYNQLGRIKKALKDYSASIKYYNSALDLTTDLSEKTSIINNLAFVFIENENLDEALSLMIEANDLAYESKNIKKIATTLDNLGFIKSKLNKSSGLEEMEQAQRIREDNNFLQGQFSSYNHLAAYHYHNYAYDKSRLYLKKSNEIAQKINSPSYRIESLRQHINLSTDTLAKKYMSLSNELKNKNLLVQNKFAARRFNYEEQQRIALQSEREKKAYQLIFLGVLIIGTLGFFLMRIRHKKTKLQNIYDTEFRLSKRIHDEVANDIYQAMAKVESNTPKEKLLDFLDNIYFKTRDISRENRIITQNDDFIVSLKDLMSSYKSVHVNVISKGLSNVNWNKIPLLKQVTIFRVIQELLTNMKKHSSANLVVLIFNTTNNKIEINYNDNGVGANLKFKSGLQNTENRIDTIGGKITFETRPDSGFKAKLVI